MAQNVLQGLDTIPFEIWKESGDWAQIFKTYLPGWSGDGEYNFQIGARITVTGALSPLLTRASATDSHVVMARYITGITHLSP